LDDATRAHRTTWTAFAGGVSICYAFLFLLPELADIRAAELFALMPEHARGEPVFAVTMLGMLAYLFLARRAEPAPRGAAALEAAFVALYFVALGATLAHPRRDGLVPPVIALLGLSIHLLSLDHQVRHRMQALFDRRLRWVFASSVLAGFGLAAMGLISEPGHALATATVAGMVLVTVLREEIPADPRGRTAPLLAGVSFGLILLITLWLAAPLAG
jgi:hypothetical protein